MSYNSESIPENIKARAKSIGSKNDIISTDSLVDFYAKMAELTFSEDGYHVPILMFFDSEYKIIDLLSTSFDDQADKFIFWRLAAERAKLINAFGFVWVAELWVRNSKINSTKAIHQMPIVDEKLQIIGIDSDNYKKSVSWQVLRKDEQSKPTLSQAEIVDLNEGQFFYMRPILKAIGGDISKLNG